MKGRPPPAQIPPPPQVRLPPLSNVVAAAAVRPCEKARSPTFRPWKRWKWTMVTQHPLARPCANSVASNSVMPLPDWVLRVALWAPFPHLPSPPAAIAVAVAKEVRRRVLRALAPFLKSLVGCGRGHPVRKAPILVGLWLTMILT